MSLIQFVNNFGEPLEQGDVIVIGAMAASGSHRVADGAVTIEADATASAYDTRVCGIVCGLHTELKLESDEEADSSAKPRKKAEGKPPKKGGKAEGSSRQAFTLAELESLDRTKVHPGQLGYAITQGACSDCKVDADVAPIKVGDLLTTSPTKGHAQKVLDPSKAIGAIIGKALGSLKKGKGKIPVLVSLQ